MEPQDDDPEKRIRDLERPLADTARTSEMGGTQPPDYSSPPGSYPPGSYPPGPPVPPPPPVYGYGGPFLGTPPKPSGNRMWWIVGTVIVIGVLALAGGIAAYAANRLSGVRSIISSSMPSTSQVTSSQKTNPRSPTPSASATRTPSAGPSTLPLPPPGGELSVSGVNENKTVACNDTEVTVSGISNTIVIAGHCASLTVSGMNNSVTVDAVDTIEASGLNNRVTFHSGSPQITKSGSGNVVQQG